MLKVNLLVDKSADRSSKKNSPSEVTGTSSTNFKDIFGDGLEVKSGPDVKEQAAKLVLLFGFLAGLYAYEQVQLDKNKKVISAKNLEVNELQVLLEQKAQSVANLSQLKDERKNQNEHIEDVKSKMTQRMHMLKGLDYIQSAMVKDLWLSSLDYESGAFTLVGLFLQKSSLDQFYKNLNKVPVFNKSLIIRDSESSSGVEGAYEFSIMTKLKLNLEPKEDDFGV